MIRERLYGWYDTKEGIATSIGSLAEFNELADARRQAGYKRRERLHDFVILGRWYYDTCGNLGKLQGSFYSSECFQTIPQILTYQEFLTWLEKNGLAGTVTVLQTSKDHLPPVSLTCFECKRPWGIHNAHDMITKNRLDTLSAENFIGMTLREVRDFFKTCTEEQYHVRFDKPIRHDRFINLNPKPDSPSLQINFNGSAGKEEGITDSYVIAEGDDINLDIWRAFHSTCNRVCLERDQRQLFADVFLKAGYQDVEFKAVENQYCGCEFCAPWYEVTTSFGVILIGRRKHVINIDWSATILKLAPVAGDTGVTAGPGFTHAWGYDKVAEYLELIRLSAESVPA